MSYRRNVRITSSKPAPTFSSTRIVTQAPVTTHRSRVISNQPIITRRERIITSDPILTHRSYVTEPVLTHHRVTTEPIISETRTVTSTASSSPPRQNVLGAMEEKLTGELEGRNRDWENQVEKIQQDFFGGKTMASEGGSKASTTADPLDLNNVNNLFVDNPDGSRMFRVRFDLHDYEPSDMKVRTTNGILHIVAQKEFKDGDDKRTRRFNRTVEIPRGVDPDLLTSSFSEEGVLTIEAPAPPDYNTISQRFSSKDVPVIASISRTVPTEGAKDSISRVNAPFILGKDGEQIMKLVVDVGSGYKQDDVLVHAYGVKVVVDGKIEQKVGDRVSRKSYSREFDLPEFVDPFTMRARWSQNGHLTIAAMCLGYRCSQDAAIQKVEEQLPEDGKACTVEPY